MFDVDKLWAWPSIINIFIEKTIVILKEQKNDYSHYKFLETTKHLFRDAMVINNHRYTVKNTTYEKSREKG